jgi:type II secretory pathway component PulK
MLNQRRQNRRQASALVSALVLLIVVTMICFGLVLQFARWQGEYRDERLKTEQLMVQFTGNKNSNAEDEKAQQE